MQFVRIAILIAAGTFAARSIAQTSSPGTASPGIVEGVVINAVTGAGISGASVTLLGNQSARHETKSDVAGHFRIAGVAPGNYRARVEKDGFWPPASDRDFLANQGLLVSSTSDPVKLELTLAPFNTMRGRVLGPDGRPVAGVEVRLNPNIMANEALTDDEGRFALENTRPGSYTLIAKPPASRQPEDVDGTRTAMITTYYPSTADKSLAQSIVFLGQADFDALEIRMQTSPVHRVRGIVLDQEGEPKPGAELTLVQIPEGTPEQMGLGGRPGGSVFALGLRRPPTGAPEATAIAGKDGRFEFPSVRSGDWRINVVSDDGVSPRGAVNASVGRGDVDDLEIHAAMPFKVSGTVEWKGDDVQRVPNSGPLFGVVTLMNPDGNEFVAMGIVESGVLSFENILPGRYKALVKPGVSAQIFLGDYEVTGQIFPLTSQGPRLRVVLKSWSGTVRGTVEKCEGAMVVLVPQRFEGVALGQTAVCGAGGGFELNEVSPGDYYIAAFDRGDRLGPSPSMVSLVPSRGTSVKVEEHSAASVRLSAIAVPR